MFAAFILLAISFVAKGTPEPAQDFQASLVQVPEAVPDESAPPLGVEASGVAPDAQVPARPPPPLVDYFPPFVSQLPAVFSQFIPQLQVQRPPLVQTFPFPWLQQQQQQQPSVPRSKRQQQQYPPFPDFSQPQYQQPPPPDQGGQNGNFNDLLNQLQQANPPHIEYRPLITCLLNPILCSPNAAGAAGGLPAGGGGLAPQLGGGGLGGGGLGGLGGLGALAALAG